MIDSNYYKNRKLNKRKYLINGYIDNHYLYNDSSLYKTDWLLNIQLDKIDPSTSKCFKLKEILNRLFK